MYAIVISYGVDAMAELMGRTKKEKKGYHDVPTTVQDLRVVKATQHDKGHLAYKIRENDPNRDALKLNILPSCCLVSIGLF